MPRKGRGASGAPSFLARSRKPKWKRLGSHKFLAKPEGWLGEGAWIFHHSGPSPDNEGHFWPVPGKRLALWSPAGFKGPQGGLMPIVAIVTVLVTPHCPWKECMIGMEPMWGFCWSWGIVCILIPQVREGRNNCELQSWDVIWLSGIQCFIISPFTNIYFPSPVFPGPPFPQPTSMVDSFYLLSSLLLQSDHTYPEQ